MGKNKLQHWAELATYSHVIQASASALREQDHPMKGKWHRDFFRNENPIVLELGCGKGEYTVGLARRYPDKNFIGIDIKGARIWRGARTVKEEQLSNAGFIRTRVDFINAFFAPGEVQEIWLTFSDPQPRPGKERKRLSSPLFVSRYRQLLAPGGIVHLKTDSDLLYEYTVEQTRDQHYGVLLSTADLYGELIDHLDEATREILAIRTFYEQKWLEMGKTIKYLKFTIDPK